MAVRCSVTGKIGYESVRSARRANHKNKRRLRMYRCKFCNRIHVTKEVKAESSREDS